MENHQAEETVLGVLDFLLDVATGQKALDGVSNDLSNRSDFDLSRYESKCVVDVSDDEGSWVKGDGDNSPLKGEDSVCLFDDVPMSHNPIDWKSLMDSKQCNYITHWNFFPESSENLLNLQPHEMCENWDADEDKRRKVYWTSRGLIQERYIRTLFREMDTPDEARPTLARVSSQELISGSVPHVSCMVSSRRLPSGVSKNSAKFAPRPRARDDSWTRENARKPLVKRIASALTKTLSRAWI